MKSVMEEVLKEKAREPAKRIIVAGVGNAGCNMVNGLGFLKSDGLSVIAINSDKEALKLINKDVKTVLIGKDILNGLGAAGDPDISRKAAIADSKIISKALGGADVVYLVAGLGGGIGTGASEAIAEIAQKKGIAVKALVTYPFNLERTRQSRANEGIARLVGKCDSMLIANNNLLLKEYGNKSMSYGFAKMDGIIAKHIELWASRKTKDGSKYEKG
jgi:cell division protein FtsZ